MNMKGFWGYGPLSQEIFKTKNENVTFQIFMIIYGVV